MLYFLFLNVNLFATNKIGSSLKSTSTDCYISLPNANSGASGIIPFSGGAESSENEEFKKESDHKDLKIQAAEPIFEIFRYNTIKSTTNEFGKLLQRSIPISLIILYHSWKGNLHS